MAFKTRKKEEFSYASPQEMYQDNKLKKIMGPLDYQAAMLDLYIKNIDQKTVALELPTGSGKTLVGLLIVSVIDGVNWSFSNQKFVQFISELEKYSKWSYSGESELLLIELKNGILSYKNVMLFH